VCDVTAHACDPHCCCDADCPADLIKRERALNQCTAREGPSASTVRKCVDLERDRSLVYVNPKDRMSLERTPGGDTVFCIAVDNNPLAGSFLQTPLALSSADITGTSAADTGSGGMTSAYAALLDQPAVAAAAAFDYRREGSTLGDTTPGVASLYARETTSIASAAAFYSVGSRIQAAVDTVASAAVLNDPLARSAEQVGGDLRPLTGGFLSLPVRDPSTGLCSGSDGATVLPSLHGAFGSFALFHDAARRAPETCAMHLPTGLSQEVCAALSPSAHANRVYVASAPNAEIGERAGTGHPWVRVTMGAVANVESTGTEGDRISQITLLADGSNSEASALAVEAAWTWNATDCSCSGAAVAQSLMLYTSATAPVTLLGGSVDYQLTRLQQEPSQCGQAPLNVPFSSSLRFVTPEAAGNDGTLPRADEQSGNPGYRHGAPVLAGVMITQSGGLPASAAADDRRAVARSVASAALSIFALHANSTGMGSSLMGMSMRGPAADGSCLSAQSASSASASRYDAAYSLPVTYGEDASLGCALRLTLTELADICLSLAASPGETLSYMGLGSVLAPAPSGGSSGGVSSRLPTHVGMYGNADPLRPWEWVSMSLPAALPGAPIWNPRTSTCSGLLAGVDVEFLTIGTGEARNPQSKIVGARVRYVTDTWRFTRESARAVGDLDGDSVTQPFLLRTTVSWKALPQVTMDYVPPVPPVIPPLPADLFYPFISVNSGGDEANTASSAAGAPFLGASTIVMACVAMLVAALQLLNQ
jgi:hypothetical protein